MGKLIQKFRASFFEIYPKTKEVTKNFGIHDFPVQIEGDTLKGRSFIFEYFEGDVLRSLVNAKVIFTISKKCGHKIAILTSDSPDQISITDPLKCVVTVHNIPQGQEDDLIPAGNYYWRLKVEYQDGLEHTFIGGEYQIIKQPKTQRLRL